MRAPIGGSTVVLLGAALIIGFHWDQWRSLELNTATVFFAAIAAMYLWILSASARGKGFAHLPLAEGRVVAIVPAYNEDPETLVQCVASLLAQTRKLDHIVIVDDGSITPVVPHLDHPDVTWLRQENKGKRHAQIAGLQGHRDADFILTVDSDSIVDPDAVEHLLRAMSEDDVHAVTGNGVVRNYRTNLLTRLTDLEFVYGNLTMRRMRSSLGVVAPCSGPLSLYRAGVVFDNVGDYLTSGTYGDDRRLTHYALQRGRVVANDDAVVQMDMPDTFMGIYRQRLRWFKGYVKYLVWELRNLDGAALYLRTWNLLLLLLFPVVFLWALVIEPLTAGQFYWQAWLYWIGLLYLMTSHYLVGRPHMSFRERTLSWLLLTPLIIVLQFVILRPAMYWAFVKVRDSAWHTRDIVDVPA